jgi:4a-hydroxytetrahydrobiopterin dehydratase
LPQRRGCANLLKPFAWPERSHPQKHHAPAAHFWMWRNSQGRRAMAHYKILDEAEIKSELKKLPDWSVKGNNIEASFDFKGFRDAISFIVQIAIEAEVQNHHPEFHNSYNKVSFSYCTHDAGHKLTDLDIKMASSISEIAKRFLGMP